MAVERHLIESAQLIPDSVEFDWGSGLRLKPKYTEPLSPTTLVVVKNGSPESPFWLTYIKDVIVNDDEVHYRVPTSRKPAAEVVFDETQHGIGRYVSSNGQYTMLNARLLGPQGLAHYGVDISDRSKRVLV